MENSLAAFLKAICILSFFFAFRLIWYFIAQQVQFNEEKGRHMVATNNIKGGQIISAELEPLAFIIFDPLQGIIRMKFVFDLHIPDPSVFSFL